MSAIAYRDFSHITVRVSDLERALRFYRDGLGLRPLFDVRLDGPGLDAVTATPGARGRMIGLLVPGAGKVSIELIHFEHPSLSPPPEGRFTGWSNISISVADIDATHAAFLERGLAPLSPPVEVGGVRMFFVTDPDGARIEIIEFSGGHTTSAAWNGA
ncbi:MAG: VOC family protein [Myxococcota bacterium]